MISVIIATRNRPIQLISCLEAISANTIDSYEVLLADQSDKQNPAIQNFIRRHPRIRYYHVTKHNKSQALNAVIPKALGNILAFTDDDCLPTKTWLCAIQKSFSQYPHISGVFGQTLPYHPTAHPHQQCPSIFLKDYHEIISQPCVHYKHIGFGNNMAYTKDVFLSSGRFKQWLGPGSIGCAAEDAEFVLRLLIKKHTVLYNPNVKIYHDRWLDAAARQKRALSYICGETACYGYFYFQRHMFATPIVLNNIRDSYYTFRSILKNILLLRINKTLLQNISYAFAQMFYRTKGLAVACIYSFIDPIR